MSAADHPPPYELSYDPAFQNSQEDKSAVIKNIESGLVLDASEEEVKIQNFNGSPAQFWTLEPAGEGRYIIKNRGNGGVLDIQGGPECGAKLIIYEQHGGENQQWYIKADRTIVSAGGDLAIDIYEGNCEPGSNLIAYDVHGGPNQQFNVEYQ